MGYHRTLPTTDIDSYYLATISAERRRKRLPDYCKFGVNDMGTAMDMTSEIGSAELIPLIWAVAQEVIKPKAIFDITEKALQDPKDLALAKDLRRAAQEFWPNRTS